MGIDEDYFVWVPPNPNDELAAWMLTELQYLTPESRGLGDSPGSGHDAIPTRSTVHFAANWAVSCKVLEGAKTGQQHQMYRSKVYQFDSRRLGNLFTARGQATDRQFRLAAQDKVV